MRFRIFSVVAGLAVAVGVAVSVSTAGASRPINPTSAGASAKGQAHVITTAPDTLTTLYDNNNNDSGVGVVSQNFESQFDAYDSQDADDVAVPATTIWKVKQVIVTGVYFNGSGPAASENVFFYKNKHGLPGDLLKEYDGILGTDNGTGSFVIKLPSVARLNGGTAGKSFWVSVQANMDFSVGGEWGWEGSLNTVGKPAAWQNPGDGFATGCTTWGVETTCIGDVGQGPSKMLKLRGTIG